MILSPVNVALSVGLRLILTMDPFGFPNAPVLSGRDPSGADSVVGVVSTAGGLEPSHCVSNMSHYSSAIGGPGVSTPFYFLLNLESNCVARWTPEPPSANTALVGDYYVGRVQLSDFSYATGKIPVGQQQLHYYTGNGDVGISDTFQTLSVDCMDQKWLSPGITLQLALKDEVPVNAIAASPDVYVGAGRCYRPNNPDVHVGAAALVSDAAYFACLQTSYKDSTTKVFVTLDEGYTVAWVPFTPEDTFPENAVRLGSNLRGWEYYIGRAFTEDWDAVMPGVVDHNLLAVPSKNLDGSTVLYEYEVLVVRAI